MKADLVRRAVGRVVEGSLTAVALLLVVSGIVILVSSFRGDP